MSRLARSNSIAHVTTKSLVSKDSPLTNLFYITLIQLPIAAIASWSTLTMPSLALWPWVIIVGLTALSADYCLAQSLAIGDASIVLPIFISHTIWHILNQ